MVSISNKFPLFGVAGAIFAMCVSGCQTKPAPQVSVKPGYYAVHERQTSFYRYGPAQSFGPDFSLTKGQRVVMLRYENGYSRVMMDDGTSGYVSTDDLSPAPPPPPEMRKRMITETEEEVSRSKSGKKLTASGKKSKTKTGTTKGRTRQSAGPSGKPSGKPSGPSPANRAILQGAPLFESSEPPPLPDKSKPEKLELPSDPVPAN